MSRVTPAVCEALFAIVTTDEVDGDRLHGILERRVRNPYDASLVVFSLLATAAAMHWLTEDEHPEFYGIEVVELKAGTTEQRQAISLAVAQSFVAHLNHETDTAVNVIAGYLDEHAVVHVMSDTLLLVRQVVRAIDPTRLASVTAEQLDAWWQR